MKRYVVALLCLGWGLTAHAEDTLEGEIIIEEITGDLIDLDQLSDEATTIDSDFITQSLPEAAIPPNPESETEPVAETQPEPAEDTQPTPADVKVNVVNVGETFYRLVLNNETNVYTRTETNEARPGDLIEIVISAVNASDERVADVELINTVPQGPLRLVENSFQTDLTNSLYRISRNGETFFPADAGLDANSIQFIQWVIFSLEPNQQIDFKYRIRINQ